MIHSYRMTIGKHTTKTTCGLMSIPKEDKVTIEDIKITCPKCYKIIKERYEERKKFIKNF